MPAIKIAQFGGMIPAVDPQLLPDNAASLSENVWLKNGTLQGWKAPRQLRALTNSAAEVVYRIPNNMSETDTFTNSLWLEFEDPTVNVIRAPMLQDTYSRYYFLGETLDPTYNTLGRIQTGQDALKLGIPAPASQASVIAQSGYVLNAETVIAITAGNPTAIRWDLLESKAGTTNGIMNVARTNNIATIGVEAGHGFSIGNIVKVVSEEYGEQAPVATSQRFISTVARSSNVATITTTTNHGLSIGDIVRINPTDTNEFAETSASNVSITENSRTDNVVSITTSSAHGYEAGDVVRISTTQTTINGDYMITSVPSTTQFTYTKSGSDHTTTPYTGTSKKLTTGFGGTYEVTSITSTTFSYDSIGDDVSSTSDTGDMTQMTTGFDGTFELTSVSAGTVSYVSYGENVASISSSGNVTEYQNGERINRSGNTIYGSIILAANSNVTEMISRSYLYTYVSEYGEEGPPSPASVKTGAVSSAWEITLNAPSSTVTDDRAIEKYRIYRTITASNGVTSYFFVDEIDISQSVYIDTKSDEDISSNDILESTNWYPPPVDLKGWVTMPNGIIAAWKDNELWFSEPYRPHAWPPSYQVSVDFPIVGLGVMGQTLIVATKGSPWAATGVTPTSISLSKINTFEPCQSRGSIISTPSGVYYASANGIVAAVPGKLQLVTTEIISPAQWQVENELKQLKAVEFDGGYLAYEIGSSSSTRGFFLNVSTQRIAYNELSDPEVGLVNVCIDPWTALPLLIRDGYVYVIDHPDGQGQQTYKWKSKEFSLPYSRNVSVMKVRFMVPSDAPTLSTTRNTSASQSLASDQYALVRLYADDAVVLTRELRKSNEHIALPSGYKSSRYQIEIEGRVSIFDIQMGTSSAELKNA